MPPAPPDPSPPEQEAAYARLAVEHRRALAMLAHMPGFAAMVEGPEHRFVYWNEAYEALVRRPLRLGASVRELFPEIADQGFNELLDQVFRSGEPYVAADVPARLEREDGERVLDLNFEPIRGGAGDAVTGIFISGHDVTDKVRAQRAVVEERDRLAAVHAELQESERRFRLMADSSPAMIWVANERAEVVFANRRYEDLFGKPVEQMTQADWARLVHPDDLALFFPTINAAAKRRAKYVQDVRVYDRDGQLRWLHCTGLPRYTSDGAYAGYVGVNVDVTEARIAEQRLRESEEHFRNTVELNPQVTWTAQPDGQLDRVAQRWMEWTGTTGLGDSWANGLHKDDREPTFAAWGHSVTTGEPYDIEHRVKMLCGEYRWARSRASPRRDDNGAIVKWYGTTEDIHERKLAEAALRESEERFREIADQAPVPMWVTAPDRTRDFVNRAYINFLGVSYDQARVFDWRSIIHPDDVGRVVAQSVAGEATLRQFTLEGRYRDAKGEYRWLRSVSSPRLGPNGEFQGFIGAAYDITIAKEAEVRLHALVEERTDDLMRAQEALRQSQKLESLGQLTGGVAHDFNNLLTPIVGTLDLLHRRGIGDRRTERLIEGAQQSAERARTLVQRLLAFARRQPLKSERIDLAQLVSGMGDLLASTCGPRIALGFDLPEALPPVETDAHQLELALLNLAVNARDAMPEGGTLTVAARVAELGPANPLDLSPGRYVTLSVADTGEGMSAETQRRAVEPFFSTKGVGQGTGLGLSMVHGLAAQSGGALTIDSIAGQGTLVTLTLPTSTRQPLAVPVEKPVEFRSEGLALLIDDEPLVRESTASMLGDLGYHVEAVDDAGTAIALIADGLRPDLVITDHLMPGMTGAELARRVRDLLPETPVLLVSGYADMAQIDPALPRLTKPFRQDELAAALRQLSVHEARA